MKTTKSEATVLTIAPVEIASFNVRIRGISPLIVHKWSEKAKRQMLEAQMQVTKTKAKHEAKNPVADFIGSAYWLTKEPEILPTDTPETAERKFIQAVENGARWGFPVTAIKQAAVNAAGRNGIDLKSTTLRGAFFIHGEGPDMLAEVKGCAPEMREDMVRVGGISKTADIRHRAMFSSWFMDLTIDYNTNGTITPEQIVNLINLAGFGVGIGEWRPEKDGSFGMFRVAAE